MALPLLGFIPALLAWLASAWASISAYIASTIAIRVALNILLITMWTSFLVVFYGVINSLLPSVTELTTATLSAPTTAGQALVGYFLEWSYFLMPPHFPFYVSGFGSAYLAHLVLLYSQRILAIKTNAHVSNSTLGGLFK